MLSPSVANLCSKLRSATVVYSNIKFGPIGSTY